MSAFTWNARALLTHDVKAARHKWTVIQTACMRHGVICVQEAHGSPHALELPAKRLSATHFGFFSAGDNADTGGLITWIKRKRVKANEIECREIVPGRILAVHAQAQGCAQVTIVNVHNVGVPKAAINELAAAAKQALATNRHMFVVIGDFNFEEDEDIAEDDRPTCRTTPRGNSEKRR